MKKKGGREDEKEKIRRTVSLPRADSVTRAYIDGDGIRGNDED